MQQGHDRKAVLCQYHHLTTYPVEQVAQAEAREAKSCIQPHQVNSADEPTLSDNESVRLIQWKRLYFGGKTHTDGKNKTREKSERHSLLSGLFRKGPGDLSGAAEM
ncbi:hypothetical protein BaRGS_00003391 [Batillaria attramentaria]|uniref:Uncharacterized protein n=1 Tax=Batillaria attramentaria TaxID=370345 RepID=A0ABD0M0C4_9CAEN